MISTFSVNNRYGLDSLSSTYLQPIVHWKKGVFYQKFPIYTKNNIKTPSAPSSKNIFRSLPLKIFRNELGGNEIYGTSKTAIHSSSYINSQLGHPGGYIFSKNNPSDTVLSALSHLLVVDSHNVVIGNSTNTVYGGSTSFEDRMENDIKLPLRSWNSECICKDAMENKTYCPIQPKSTYTGVYLDKIKKNTCLTTSGNALTRVRNRGAFNCGGGSGNISYRPQYSSTKNINILTSSSRSLQN